ncbi:hypothetical protein NE865_10190 [Phthorimaea operculella]|nr:hypothetical protein NE865_10190 [Phthorimaea operculella]
MSNTKIVHKLSEKSRTDLQATGKHDDKGEVISCADSESRTYAVTTVSKKPSASGEEETPSCAGQRSFISIHSTDQLCQQDDGDSSEVLDECNVEVLSLNEVFPSTSEESLSNEDESPLQKKQKNIKSKVMPKTQVEHAGKSAYLPSNSKSSTNSGRQKEPVEQQPSVHSDYDIPKNTLYVVGSNPGEPKMSYPDSPKKISKTMKKFLRNIDKHKNDPGSKSAEKVLNKKLTAMRGILKDARCAPECTGDSSVHPEEYNPQSFSFPTEDQSMSFEIDYSKYSKHGQDKNVSFNTQVVIIHFSGDLCVGQSVETLSKEKDQQARNSELRKTFLTKYNEFWPTQK